MTLVFERVRVCPTCYIIYKQLEKYYFKNLQKLQQKKIKRLPKNPGLVRSVTFQKF